MGKILDLVRAIIVSLNEYVTPWNTRDAFAVLPAAPGNVYEKSNIPL